MYLNAYTIIQHFLFLFARLWVHEAMRVFYDRLIDDNDRIWLFKEIRVIADRHFLEQFDVVFKTFSNLTVCNYVIFYITLFIILNIKSYINIGYNSPKHGKSHIYQRFGH